MLLYAYIWLQDVTSAWGKFLDCKEDQFVFPCSWCVGGNFPYPSGGFEGVRSAFICLCMACGINWCVGKCLDCKEDQFCVPLLLVCE